jgi:hypothetical protein
MINIGKALSAAFATAANVVVPGSGTVVSGVANELVGSWSIGTSADPILSVGTPTQTPELAEENRVRAELQRAIHERAQLLKDAGANPNPFKASSDQNIAETERKIAEYQAKLNAPSTGGSVSAPTSVSLGSALAVTKAAAMSPVGIGIMVLIAAGMGWKWLGHSNHP